MMIITLVDGKLEYDNEDAYLIMCCSELIRNCVEQYGMYIEVGKIGVEEFKEWYKAMKEYAVDNIIVDKKSDIYMTHEYLCGINTYKNITQNVAELKNVEILKGVFKYIDEDSVLTKLVRADFLEGMIYAYEKGCVPDSYVYESACGAGSLECLKFAHEHGFIMSNRKNYGNNVYTEAIGSGNMECLKYLHKIGCEWDCSACTKAAKEGRLDMLKYLHENGCEWNQGVCDSAADSGDLEILKYAYENGCDMGSAGHHAARKGKLECLKYIYENGYKFNEYMCSSALEGGIDCLRYVVENGGVMLSNICNEAAQEGDLECLKYVHEKGMKLDESVLEDAFDGRKTKCVMYVAEILFGENSGLSEKDKERLNKHYGEDGLHMVKCMCAVMEGDVNTLRQLHLETGKPFTTRIALLAIGNDKYECLKYVCDNGASFNGDMYGCITIGYERYCRSCEYTHFERTCSKCEDYIYDLIHGTHTYLFAHVCNDVNIYKYLHSKGLKLDPKSCVLAANGGDLEMLKYAHENGCKWDTKVCEAAACHGNLECLKYAHENGCEWDEMACTMAAINGNLKCLKYLHENGCKWDSKTVEAALECYKNDSIPCLRYALENGCPMSDKIEMTEKHARKYASAMKGKNMK